jgi:hypothetical protein
MGDTRIVNETEDGIVWMKIASPSKERWVRNDNL